MITQHKRYLVKNAFFCLHFTGTDLLQVAAHEFGHVLGLQHTAVSKSLMSPFYFFRYPLKLSEDDKQGIQYLYGKPKSEMNFDLDQEEKPYQPDIETNEIVNVHVSIFGILLPKEYFLLMQTIRRLLAIT